MVAVTPSIVYAAQMITARQIRAARALAGWTQEELAAKAGLSIAALNNLERGATDPRSSTIRAIETAFAAAGVTFIDGGAASIGGGAGVRLAG